MRILISGYHALFVNSLGNKMNEKKIQALAEQAKLGPCCESQAVAIEKFAELIVRECMYVGRLSQINNGLVDSDIKEHFGVEE
jgi:hypothetical protein